MSIIHRQPVVRYSDLMALLSAGTNNSYFDVHQETYRHEVDDKHILADIAKEGMSYLDWQEVNRVLKEQGAKPGETVIIEMW